MYIPDSKFLLTLRKTCVGDIVFGDEREVKLKGLAGPHRVSNAGLNASVDTVSNRVRLTWRSTGCSAPFAAPLTAARNPVLSSRVEG